MSEPRHVYTIVGPEEYKAPDYARVVRQLTEAELRDDLAASRGEPGYREAAQAELDRRQDTT